MDNVIDILKGIDAIATDSHFVYTSGKHGSVYIRKDKLYPHTKTTSQVCKLFAEKCKDFDIDVVVGPSIGGIILSQWVAYHLSEIKGKEILGVFTEKDENSNQVFKREYDLLVKGKKTLIVEDLTTTGGSVKKVIESVRQAGGEVMLTCVMVNRDQEKVNETTLGAPFLSLGVLKADAYDPVDCPLCKEDVPINAQVGHGKKFIEGKK